MDFDKEKDLLFDYINKNIDLCSLEDRMTILTKIISNIGVGKIQRCKGGSNVFLHDMTIELLKEIKSYLEEINSKNKIDFSDIENKSS